MLVINVFVSCIHLFVINVAMYINQNEEKLLETEPPAQFKAIEYNLLRKVTKLSKS